MDNTIVYQSLIGSFQWTVSLGQIDMAVLVGTKSLFPAAPCQCHLDRVKQMCGYLAAKKSAAIHIRTNKPTNYSSVPVPTFDWERIYGNVEEIIPDDIPEPLGKSVITTTYLGTNLLHCLATGRSVSGILHHLLNKTPVDWFLKKQSAVETATYGSKFTSDEHPFDSQGEKIVRGFTAENQRGQHLAKPDSALTHQAWLAHWLMCGSAPGCLLHRSTLPSSLGSSWQ